MGNSRLRILHVSDLHARAARDSKRAWKRAQVLGDAWRRNLDEITDDGHAVDIVALTGDIADWGIEDEYRAATSFIDATFARLELPINRLFVVPGNHDVHRPTEIEAWRGIRQGIWSQPQAVGEWLAGASSVPFGFADEWAEAIMRRERAFWRWLSHDLGRDDLLPKNSPHARLGYRTSMDMPGGPAPVSIIGLVY